MAEVEVPEGSARPTGEGIPAFLMPYIIYGVEPGDDRFSNKRLGDAKFAAKLYREIESKRIFK